MTSSPPRVLLDTTVFCGALLNERGMNMRILRPANGTLKEFDEGDLHVALAVVEHGPDILVTSNVDDMAPLSNLCEVMPPSRFLQYLGLPRNEIDILEGPTKPPKRQREAVPPVRLFRLFPKQVRQ